MTMTWIELTIATIGSSVVTALLIASWMRKRIAVVIDKAPDTLSDALAAHIGSDEGRAFFLGEGALQWIQSELNTHAKEGKIHLHATGHQAESVDQSQLIQRLSDLIVDWALSEELESRVVAWCQNLHQNHADKTLEGILPSPVILALDKGIEWLSKVPQKNSRWITAVIQSFRTQERLIGEFISERTLDEIMDMIEARLRFLANNTDILDHPVILDVFLPWWADYSKEKISFWESAGVGLFNTFKLGLPVNPADGRAVYKWWSDPENQQKTKETLHQKINEMLSSDYRLLLRDKIQAQRERRVCDFIAEIPDSVFESFENALITEATSPEWEHWLFGSTEKLVHFALKRRISEYLDDLNGWRPEADMGVEEALSENVKRAFTWCRSEQMGPEIKRWLTNFFKDWLAEVHVESGTTKPLLEKSLNKAHQSLEKELRDNGRLRKALKASLAPSQKRAKNWNKNMGGGIWKIGLVATTIGSLTTVIVLAISHLI